MTHLNDLQCSLYVDAAQPQSETLSVEAHLQSCAECRVRIAEFVEEKNLIQIAFSSEETITVPDFRAKFSRAGFREFAIANIFAASMMWLIQFLWKTLFGELVINAFYEISSIYLPGAYDLVVSTTLYLTQEGTVMIETYLGLIILSVTVTTLAWLVFSYRRARATISLGLLVVVCGSLVAPTPANALEVRTNQGLLTVPETETIDDSLVVAAETVVIDGTVTGNLIAVGRRVVVNGKIAGSLVTFAEFITIDGEIDGNVVSGASSVELNGTVVEGDFLGGAEKLILNRESRIGGNSIMIGQTATVGAEIGRDMFVFGETVELSGRVGEDLEAFTARVRLLGDAIIGGNLGFHGGEESRLQRSPDAKINGVVEFLVMPESLESKSRYLTVNFYLRQLVWLVSAMIVGVGLMWLIPDLREVILAGGGKGLKTAGIGLIALISTPVIAMLVAVTLVGIPVAIIGFFSWLLVIYLAKIVLASVIGQMLLAPSDKDDSLPLTLLAGLAAIVVVINLPAIGGILNFILTIVGIGLIVQLILDYISGVGERVEYS